MILRARSTSISSEQNKKRKSCSENMWKVCSFYSQNNKIVWLSKTHFWKNSSAVQTHVGLFFFLIVIFDATTSYHMESTANESNSHIWFSFLANCYHVIWVSLPSQLAPEKPTNLYILCEFLKQFLNHKILFFLYRIHLSHVLCFVCCSSDLDILNAQRILDFVQLDYPQINAVRKSDHTVYFGREFSAPSLKMVGDGVAITRQLTHDQPLRGWPILQVLCCLFLYSYPYPH